jgi:hypothetical protein
MTCGGSIVHKLKGLIAFVAATLGGIAPALAGDVLATVTAVPPSVTQSRTAPLLLPTFASYSVVITNTKPRPVNGVRLVATTTINNGTDTAKFYAAKSDSRCSSTNAGETSISCAFVQVASGASESFTVTFKAPTDGVQINFAWQVVWDESGVPGSDGPTGTTPTLLTQPSTDDVTTYVPANGTPTTLFTGTTQCAADVGCIATSADPWTTTVTLPSTANAVTSKVDEKKDVACARAADLLDCRTSTLTIPGYVAPGTTYITIILRRDATTIAKGAKISSATISYDGATTPDSRISYPYTVLACTDTTWGPLPQIGIPCEDRMLRVEYPKKSTPKNPVPAGYEGDWVFVIRAKDNGRYAE